MQPNSELGIFRCQCHGFVEPCLANHQTGGGQNPLTMSANHCVVDACGTAEIVRIDYESASSWRCGPGIVQMFLKLARGGCAFRPHNSGTWRRKQSETNYATPGESYA